MKRRQSAVATAKPRDSLEKKITVELINRAKVPQTALALVRVTEGKWQNPAQASAANGTILL